MGITRVINDAFYFYYLIIILRIFLTWVPNINWGQQPFKAMRELTDGYLDIFKRIIPPVGGLDFSPIIALVALQLVQGLVMGLISSFVG